MSILFAILKIILFVIIFIVLFLLLSLCILLLVPVRYSVDAKKDDKIHVDVRATWFFRIIKIKYLFFEGNQEITCTVFGKNLIGRSPKESKSPRKGLFRKRKPPDKEEGGLQDEPLLTEKNLQENEAHINESSIIEESLGKADNLIEEVLQTEDQKEPKTDKKKKFRKKEKPAEEKDNSSEKKKKEGWRDRLQRIKEQLADYKNKFDSIFHHKDRDIIIKHTITLCKAWIRKLKPQRYSADIEFGLEDPSLTGYIKGILCSTYYFFPVRVNAVPNFEKKILLFNIYVKGKLSLWDLGYPLLRYVLRKPIWRIIMQLIKRK